MYALLPACGFSRIYGAPGRERETQSSNAVRATLNLRYCLLATQSVLLGVYFLLFGPYLILTTVLVVEQFIGPFANKRSERDRL